MSEAQLHRCLSGAHKVKVVKRARSHLENGCRKESLETFDQVADKRACVTGAHRVKNAHAACTVLEQQHKHVDDSSTNGNVNGITHVHPEALGRHITSACGAHRVLHAQKARFALQAAHQTHSEEEDYHPTTTLCITCADRIKDIHAADQKMELEYASISTSIQSICGANKVRNPARAREYFMQARMSIHVHRETDEEKHDANCIRREKRQLGIGCISQREEAREHFHRACRHYESAYGATSHHPEPPTSCALGMSHLRQEQCRRHLHQSHQAYGRANENRAGREGKALSRRPQHPLGMHKCDNERARGHVHNAYAGQGLHQRPKISSHHLGMHQCNGAAARSCFHDAHRKNRGLTTNTTQSHHLGMHRCDQNAARAHLHAHSRDLSRAGAHSNQSHYLGMHHADAEHARSTLHQCHRSDASLHPIRPSQHSSPMSHQQHPLGLHKGTINSAKARECLNRAHKASGARLQHDGGPQHGRPMCQTKHPLGLHKGSIHSAKARESLHGAYNASHAGPASHKSSQHGRPLSRKQHPLGLHKGSIHSAKARDSLHAAHRSAGSHMQPHGGAKNGKPLSQAKHPLGLHKGNVHSAKARDCLQQAHKSGRVTSQQHGDVEHGKPRCQTKHPLGLHKGSIHSAKARDCLHKNHRAMGGHSPNRLGQHRPLPHHPLGLHRGALHSSKCKEALHERHAVHMAQNPHDYDHHLLDHLAHGAEHEAHRAGSALHRDGRALEHEARQGGHMLDEAAKAGIRHGEHMLSKLDHEAKEGVHDAEKLAKHGLHDANVLAEELVPGLGKAEHLVEGEAKKLEDKFERGPLGALDRLAKHEGEKFEHDMEHGLHDAERDAKGLLHGAEKDAHELGRLLEHGGKDVEHLLGKGLHGAEREAGHMLRDGEKDVRGAEHLLGRGVRGAEHEAGHLLRDGEKDVERAGHLLGREGKEAEHLLGKGINGAEHKAGHLLRDGEKDLGRAEHLLGRGGKEAEHLLGKGVHGAEHEAGHLLRDGEKDLGHAGHLLGRGGKDAEHLLGQGLHGAEHEAGHLLRNGKRDAGDAGRLLEKGGRETEHVLGKGLHEAEHGFDHLGRDAARDARGAGRMLEHGGRDVAHAARTGLHDTEREVDRLSHDAGREICDTDRHLEHGKKALERDARYGLRAAESEGGHLARKGEEDVRKGERDTEQGYRDAKRVGERGLHDAERDGDHLAHHARQDEHSLLNQTCRVGRHDEEKAKRFLEESHRHLDHGLGDAERDGHHLSHHLREDEHSLLSRTCKADRHDEEHARRFLEEGHRQLDRAVNDGERRGRALEEHARHNERSLMHGACSAGNHEKNEAKRHFEETHTHIEHGVNDMERDGRAFGDVVRHSERSLLRGACSAGRHETADAKRHFEETHRHLGHDFDDAKEQGRSFERSATHAERSLLHNVCESGHHDKTQARRSFEHFHEQEHHEVEDIDKHGRNFAGHSDREERSLLRETCEADRHLKHLAKDHFEESHRRTGGSLDHRQESSSNRTGREERPLLRQSCRAGHHEKETAKHFFESRHTDSKTRSSREEEASFHDHSILGEAHRAGHHDSSLTKHSFEESHANFKRISESRETRITGAHEEDQNDEHEWQQTKSSIASRQVGPDHTREASRSLVQFSYQSHNIEAAKAHYHKQARHVASSDRNETSRSAIGLGLDRVHEKETSARHFTEGHMSAKHEKSETRRDEASTRNSLFEARSGCGITIRHQSLSKSTYERLMSAHTSSTADEEEDRSVSFSRSVREKTTAKAKYESAAAVSHIERTKSQNQACSAMSVKQTSLAKEKYEAMMSRDSFTAETFICSARSVKQPHIAKRSYESMISTSMSTTRYGMSGRFEMFSYSHSVAQGRASKKHYERSLSLLDKEQTTRTAHSSSETMPCSAKSVKQKDLAKRSYESMVDRETVDIGDTHGYRFEKFSFTYSETEMRASKERYEGSMRGLDSGINRNGPVSTFACTDPDHETTIFQSGAHSVADFSAAGRKYESIVHGYVLARTKSSARPRNTAQRGDTPTTPDRKVRISEPTDFHSSPQKQGSHDHEAHISLLPTSGTPRLVRRSQSTKKKSSPDSLRPSNSRHGRAPSVSRFPVRAPAEHANGEKEPAMQGLGIKDHAPQRESDMSRKDSPEHDRHPSASEHGRNDNERKDRPEGTSGPRDSASRGRPSDAASPHHSRPSSPRTGSPQPGQLHRVSTRVMQDEADHKIRAEAAERRKRVEEQMRKAKEVRERQEGEQAKQEEAEEKAGRDERKGDEGRSGRDEKEKAERNRDPERAGRDEEKTQRDGDLKERSRDDDEHKKQEGPEKQGEAGSRHEAERSDPSDPAHHFNPDIAASYDDDDDDAKDTEANKEPISDKDDYASFLAWKKEKARAQAGSAASTSSAAPKGDDDNTPSSTALNALQHKDGMALLHHFAGTSSDPNATAASDDVLPFAFAGILARSMGAAGGAEGGTSQAQGTTAGWTKDHTNAAFNLLARGSMVMMKHYWGLADTEGSRRLGEVHRRNGVGM